RGREHARAPIDLARGPLLRPLLLRLGPSDHLLVLVTHHIVVDQVSLGLLGWELAKLYDHRVGTGTGTASTEDPLPLPPVQYPDFVAWQQERFDSGELEPDLEFWRRHLEGLPPTLDLPTDRPRPGDTEFISGYHRFRWPQELVAALEERAREFKTTLSVLLITGFEILLYQLSGVTDLALGAPQAGRNRRELARVVGLFYNPVVLRTSLAGNPTLSAAARRTAAAALDAYSHQEVPFDRLVEALRPPRAMGRPPLFQVAINLQDGDFGELSMRDLELQPVDILRGPSGLDLYLSVEELGETVAGQLEYDRRLFAEETAAGLMQALESHLGALARRPEETLDSLPLHPVVERLAAAAPAAPSKRPMVLAATFTADLVQEPLQGWLDLLEIPQEVCLAPYHQVLQQLLDGSSRLRGSGNGSCVLLLRLQDWLPEETTRGDGESLARGLTEERLAVVESALEDALAGLGAAVGQGVPWLLILCPDAPELAARPEWRSAAKAWQQRLREAAEALPGVQLVTHGEIAELYPVAEAHDPFTEREGHVPFTVDYFHALATMIARRLHAVLDERPKVLALDCDNTLWGGVCAEVGVGGVDLGEPYLALQRTMLEQQRRGRLLCLSSKNREEDVWQVFDRRPEMVLAREHLVAWRIGWDSKGEGLRALAEELDLNLDSFLFLDDNPVECAEVRARCPEVLVLQVPQDPASILSFLRHLWPLDSASVTVEDRRRTLFYQQNRRRRELQSESPSLGDFLRRLELDVKIRPPRREELPRVAQLTQRTNQFNASGVRRSEGEVAALAEDGDYHLRVVRVRDRFGDYGAVGVVSWRRDRDTVSVDSLLLSCRVLGRGVEHRMLAHVGCWALEQGLDRVRIAFRQSERNEPVRRFLGSQAERAGKEGEQAYFAPAARAAEARWEPGEDAAEELQGRRPPETGDTPTADNRARARRFARIATELGTIESITAVLQQQRSSRGRAPRAPYRAPEDPLQETLTGIWGELLGLPRIGLDDDFFALGGHSLLGTVMLSRVHDAFGVELGLGDLFRVSTVAGLAELVEQELVDHMDPQQLEAQLGELEGLSPEELNQLLEQEQLS
ncbi:MAG: HAD-IIIC family phosphatase, partial [Acidobacteriota bacterium]|nr:HAD-IIIC family phosphatase [Acidobacteriota bacterium]